MWILYFNMILFSNDMHEECFKIYSWTTYEVLKYKIIFYQN